MRAIEIVHRHDIRMVKLGDDARLALKTRAECRVGRKMRVDGFDRNKAFQGAVARDENLAHAARPQGSDNLVFAKCA